jgi:hypothetical protein
MKFKKSTYFRKSVDKTFIININYQKTNFNFISSMIKVFSIRLNSRRTLNILKLDK